MAGVRDVSASQFITSKFRRFLQNSFTFSQSIKWYCFSSSSCFRNSLFFYVQCCMWWQMEINDLPAVQTVAGLAAGERATLASKDLRIALHYALHLLRRFHYSFFGSSRSHNLAGVIISLPTLPATISGIAFILSNHSKHLGNSFSILTSTK
jgi:hypothetical protein